jgi:hypothetical protein
MRVLTERLYTLFILSSEFVSRLSEEGEWNGIVFRKHSEVDFPLSADRRITGKNGVAVICALARLQHDADLRSGVVELGIRPLSVSHIWYAVGWARRRGCLLSPARASRSMMKGIRKITTAIY